MNEIKPYSFPTIGVQWESPKPLNETKAEQVPTGTRERSAPEQEPIKICRDVFTPTANEQPILSRKDLAPYMGTGGLGLPQSKTDQPLQTPPIMDMRRLMGTGGL